MVAIVFSSRSFEKELATAALSIFGVAGTIQLIAAPMTEVALTLACGIVALLLLLPNRRGLVVLGRSFLLLMLYVGFVWPTHTS